MYAHTAGVTDENGVTDEKKAIFAVSYYIKQAHTAEV